MTIYARGSTLRNTCGVGLIHDFNEGTGYYFDRWETLPINRVATNSGCGWQVAGFVNDKICAEAYEVLKKRYKIVFQAPVRKNANSRRNFFFILYDGHQKRKSKNFPDGVKLDKSGNVNYKWPF